MGRIFKKVLSMVVVVAIVICCVGVNNTTAKAVEETTNYTIKVNLGTNCTTIYNKKGKAIKAMICSPSNETPVGTFYIPIKYRWHEMIGNCYAQYCSRITGHVLFHSVWYYKNGDKSTMSVGAYNVMGNKASHGCVRLLCKDAKWIYDHCAVGTKVVIFWGDKKDDPIERPSFTPIKTGAWISWDPTDPDPKNPYRKVEPKINPEKTQIEYGSKVKPLDLVEIKDCAGNILTKSNAKIKVTGKINTKKLGKYKIKYFVKDSMGNKKTKTIAFKVVDTKKPILKGAKGKKNVAMGSSVKLLEKISAKAVSGKNLTSRVKVTVKKSGKTVKVKKGTVTFNKKGTYKVKYTVKGVNKKIRTKTVKYVVVDKRVKITLTTKNVTLNVGDSFDATSYVSSFTSYKGSNISVSKYLTVSGNVDMTTPGVYEITYTGQYKDNVFTKNSKKLIVTVNAVEVPEEETTEAPSVEEETTISPEETTTNQEETTLAEETATV